MRILALSGMVILAATLIAQDNPNRLYQLREFKTTTITYGAKSLKVWLADTSSKRQEGMMFLKSGEVSANGAMLFVFPVQAKRSFWMKNTLIPLDIAYLDSTGLVVTAKSMKPLDETGVPSTKPSKFVLEMKKGAFSRLGIRVGTKFKIPSIVRSLD